MDMACGYTRMLRPIPDHVSTIRTHRSDNVRVLRLVSCLIDLSLVIDLLDDIEFDLHGSFLRRSATVAADFLTLLVIFGGVWSDRVGQLTMDDL